MGRCLSDSEFRQLSAGGAGLGAWGRSFSLKSPKIRSFMPLAGVFITY